MPKKKFDTIINTSNTLLENSTRVKHIIQKDAFNRCLDLIIQKLELAVKYTNSKAFDRYHETITGNGERGTGKTSFVLTIEDFIKNKKEYEDPTYQKYYNNVKDVQTLKLLDPTLLSDRQKVLLTIISNISELVKKELNSCKEEQRKIWKDNLLSLAEGLNSIINIGKDPNHDSMWDDAGLILENGLLKANAGVNFEKNFHEFIEKSLEILDKKAFLLILDDIDTNFKKGWDVLETLRKYITTPKIITIISGDLSLYKQLIRNNQLNLFKDSMEYENDRYKEYTQAIDELESQYLIKILKPENYINLYRLNYFLSYKKAPNIGIQKNSEVDPIDLKDFFLELIKEGFSIKSDIQLNLYFKILSNMPIRTNMQMFKAYFDSIDTNKNTFHQRYFLQRTKDIFITLFSKYGIDLQFFEIIREDSRTDTFLSKFFHDKSLINAKELLSNELHNMNEEKNIIILILKGLYNAYSHGRNDTYLEWGLKGILTSYYFSDEIDNNKNLYSFLDLNNELDSEKRIQKLISLNNNSKNLFAVTYRDKKYSQGGLIFKNFIENTNEKGERVLGKEGLYTIKDESFLFSKILYTKLRTTGRDTKDTISFFYILSFIEKLYSFRSQFIEDKLSNDNKKELTSNINDYIKSIMIKDYRFTLSKNVNDEQQLITNSNDGTIDESRNTEEYSIRESFIQNLTSWLTTLKFNESKFTLNDINIVFNNFIKKYLDDDKYNFKVFNNISEYLQVSIYVFLNEVLKRSIYIHLNESELNNITIQEIASTRGLNNFESNLGKYLQKLTKVKIKEMQSSDFFFNLLSCPVWNYYIPDFDKFREMISIDKIAIQPLNYSKLFVHKTNEEKLSHILSLYIEQNGPIGNENLDVVDTKIIHLYKDEFNVTSTKDLPSKTKRKTIYENSFK
ncbi:hypothetical protein [Poseidonibacter lekithochrous]|uniref:hypothetical protein n=1 Tax=Poseidonibacter lekithochrous TaxID=1904463 RepID=UPI0008FC474D|nr:hypothetical protein [Poseidonibacter lekithochrous]